MIDMSEIVNDPDFCIAFTITRDPGSYMGRGGYQEQPPQTISTYGIITPSDAETIMFLPEGDRITETITVTTTTPLLLGQEGPPRTIADIINWNGQQYKVVKLLQWEPFGFYKALAQRM